MFLVFAERVEEAERQVERIATLLRPQAAIWILWGDSGDDDGDPEMTLEGLRRVLEPLELTSDKSAQVADWLAVSFVPVSPASAES